MDLYTQPWNHQDLDAVAGLWRKQTGVMRPLQPEGVHSWLLNQVAGNTFFDREGLLLTFDVSGAKTAEGGVSGRRLVGMIHAAFPPSEEFLRSHYVGGAVPQWTSPPTARRDGIIAMMIVDETLEESDKRQVANELLRYAEVYLRQKHVQIIYAGGLRPSNNPPFWNGFCGAGDAWGIPDDQLLIHDVLDTAGYRELRHTAVWRRKLSLPVPLLMEIVKAKRHCRVVATDWRPVRTWEMLTMTPGKPLEYQALASDDHQLGRLVLRKIAETDSVTGEVVDLVVVHWMAWTSGGLNALRREVILLLLDAAIQDLSDPDNLGWIEWILCSDPTYTTRVDTAKMLGFEVARRGTVRRKEI